MESPSLFSDSSLQTSDRTEKKQKNKHTNLQSAFLSCLLTITFKHFAVDSQAENLRGDFVVICHCISPELQFGRKLVLSELAAQVASQALGLHALPGVWLRRSLIYRQLLLVVIHSCSWKKSTVAHSKCHQSVPQKISGVILVNHVCASRQNI